MNWIAWGLVILVIAVWIIDKKKNTPKQSTEPTIEGEPQQKDY